MSSIITNTRNNAYNKKFIETLKAQYNKISKVFEINPQRAFYDKTNDSLNMTIETKNDLKINYNIAKLNNNREFIDNSFRYMIEVSYGINGSVNNNIECLCSSQKSCIKSLKKITDKLINILTNKDYRIIKQNYKWLMRDITDKKFKHYYAVYLYRHMLNNNNDFATMSMLANSIVDSLKEKDKVSNFMIASTNYNNETCVITLKKLPFSISITKEKDDKNNKIYRADISYSYNLVKLGNLYHVKFNHTIVFNLYNFVLLTHLYGLIKTIYHNGEIIHNSIQKS